MGTGHKNHFYGHSLPTADPVEQLSVAGKVLVNLLGLSRKSVVMLNALLDLTIVVDWDVNPPKNKKTKTKPQNLKI